MLNSKLYKVTRDEIIFLSEQESLEKVKFVFGADEAILQRNFYEVFRDPNKVLEEYDCELALLKSTSRR